MTARAEKSADQTDVERHESTDVRVSRQRSSGRAKVTAMACFGLIAGPLSIFILLSVPAVVLGFGLWHGRPDVQIIGGLLLLLHGGAALTITRALAADPGSIDGLAINPAEAPALHRVVNDLQKRLSAPRITAIIINTQLNAFVTQTPRWFGLRGHHHTLTIGLPLLQALSVDECAAVIAHEMAHLRQSDGKLNALVARVSLLWRRVESAAETNPFIGQGLVIAFARRFRPRFDAVSGAVQRENELRADADAAGLVGAASTVRAMLRIATATRTVQDQWAAFWLGNVRSSKPVAGPWDTFAATLPTATMVPSENATISAVLRSPPVPSSSHPDLAARIRNLGYKDMTALPPLLTPEPTAAHQLLGAHHKSVVRYFDQLWWRENKSRWESFFAGAASQFDRLKTLDAAAKNGELSIETAVERADRASYLIGSDAAMQRYKDCIKRFPHEAAGYFRLGCVLLEHDDATGIGHLVHAMSLDETATPNVIPRIVAFLRQNGDGRRADAYAARAAAWYRLRPSAKLNQETEISSGSMVPALLAPATVSSIRDAVASEPACKTTWLLQGPFRPWQDVGKLLIVIDGAFGRPASWQRKGLEKLRTRLGAILPEHDLDVVSVSQLGADARQALGQYDTARIKVVSDGLSNRRRQTTA